MSDHEGEPTPKLSIVLLVVGSRGDVQPYLAVARRLQEYGHRVRLATHSEFDGLVKSDGLDFYPLGGDPRILIEGFVKAKHTRSTARRYKEEYEVVLESVLPACTEPDPITGKPFQPQGPGYDCKYFFLCVEVAEALAIPLHICATLPWTPTCAFPHPLLSNLSLKFGYWKGPMELAACIEEEDGVGAAVNSFHRHLRSELALSSYIEGEGEEKEKGNVDYVQSFFDYLN